MVLFGAVVEYLEVWPCQEKQAGRLSAMWFTAWSASYQASLIASRSTEEAISRLKLLLPQPVATLTFPTTMDGIPSNCESG